jgi:hypothetical protein
LEQSFFYELSGDVYYLPEGGRPLGHESQQLLTDFYQLLCGCDQLLEGCDQLL